MRTITIHDECILCGSATFTKREAISALCQKCYSCGPTDERLAAIGRLAAAMQASPAEAVITKFRGLLKQPVELGEKLEVLKELADLLGINLSV